MNRSKKPLITITGVLGKQGSSVAKTLLADGRFAVRGITRRTDTPEARKLVRRGADLVNIPLTLGYKDAFEDAFRGSYGVFLMTPNLPPPATHETALGKELADAAAAAGVRHIVYSSLENVDQITGGRLSAPHFTDKACVEAYIRTLPVQSSFIYLAFFYTNFMEFYTPYRKDGADTLVFPIYLPEDFKAPFVDPTSATGPAVLEILSHPEQYAGASLPVIGDVLSPREVVDAFVEVTGKQAIYSSAYTRDELLSHFPDFAANKPLVEELCGMTRYAVEYGYYQKTRDLSWYRKINPHALRWKDFLRTTGWQGEKISF
ncbi:NmrA family protein [Selenomonas sp. oral taxon 137 str. F0430]|uniref:NmrA/HSCARG family protein n=1 Tax=Selenomonas sp. oral taxon 137 TaxID=712531 RepID=UPI0001EB2228|nr:NmrA/HSCARG family protein [Selenomonas sp. oral taxon 137]EFR41896.1 NmrA family protein [Selenomonas sp. oral taxon 137 str. F0430]